MTAPPVLLTGAPVRYLIDAGVFVIGSSLILYGNTKDGLTWNPGDETRHVEFDGKRADIEGQHRDIGGAAELTGNFLIGSDGSMIAATPGAESDGSEGVNTITPIDNDLFWPSGAYQNNGLYLARRQDNQIFGVHMPRFFIKTTGFKSADKNETGWAIRVVPVIPAGESGTLNLSAKPWRYLSAEELADLTEFLEALEA